MYDQQDCWQQIELNSIQIESDRHTVYPQVAIMLDWIVTVEMRSNQA